jgi:predicted TIM-barrel fold metal-dependent hydrolase
MRRLIDINHCLFDRGNDYIGFLEIDEVEAIAAEPSAPAAVQGFDLAPLLTPPLYYSLARGIEDDRRINDALLAAARRRGGRAFCVSEPKFGERAREEIHRVMTQGAAGIVWSPRAQGLFGNDASLAQLCRLVAELGGVSLVHSTPFSVNESLPRLWNLATQCGDIPLIIVGALASWENVQTIRASRGGPDNVFYDLSGIAETYDLEGLVGGIGPDRLLFGSGGPRFLTAVLDVIERSSIDPEAREPILSANAAMLFGIAQKAAAQ